MTEFRAPPPPPASFTDTPEPAAEPTTNPVPENTEVPASEPTQTATDQNPSADKMQALKSLFSSNKETFVETSKSMLASKPMLIIVAAVFVVGVLLGALLFGGGETPAPVVQGLQGVVRNPDITQPLKRCGRETEASSACVLYVMNHATYEKLARDFF